MLGDGAIVLVENAVRLLARPQDAERPRCGLMCQAATEVARPVTFGVAVIIVVFIPIAALQGMEGDIITMQEIFSFKQTRVDAQGNVKGFFKFQGVRPKFIEKFNEVPACRIAYRIKFLIYKRFSSKNSVSTTT